MALNLGRQRTDNTGSLNTILNSIKPGKVAFPKFTGKNANELNALALFIEDKFNSGHDFNRDLTSSNVDTTLERLHTTFIKLKEASDSDNLTSYELLKSDIIDQVRGLTADTGKEKPKETLWSDEDKEFLKDLIAASTLTEATEKTVDLTGENGLTKDDIDHALDVTIKKQQTLNNDVVATAQEANQIVEDDSGAALVKDELKQMFNDNKPDDSAIDELSDRSTTLFLKLQDMVSSQVGRLNAHINIVGDNFKNSPIFNYKNPFTGAVGKIPSVVETLSGTFEKLNDKIQLGIENAKVPFDKISDMMSNVKNGIIDKVSKIKVPFQKVAEGTKRLSKGISNIKNGITNKAKATKDFIVSLPKIIIGKIKDVMIGLLKKALDLLKKPFEIIKRFFISIGQKLLGILSKLGKAILADLKTIMFFIFKAIFSILKKIGGKFKKPKKTDKDKKDKKPSKLSGLLNIFKKPVTLSERIINRIALTTAKLVKGKKKKKKPGILNKITATLPPLTGKEKKEKKKTAGLFNSIGKFITKISDIIKNIVKHICDIIGQIVIALCTAIAKGIGIILRAIFLTPWGLIILASILLISIGILLISLAVKKLVDYIVDDLGPIIKEKLKMIDPKTLNRFIEKVTFFIDTFTSIIAGIFAPVIAIGKLIMAVINPVAKVVGKIAEVLAKILLPVIEFIGEMIAILIVPIMKVLKVVVLAVAKIITAVVLPVIKAIAQIIITIYNAIIKPLFDIVVVILMPLIKIIGKVIQVIWSIVKPIWDILSNVIMGILDVFKAFFDTIGPIITEVVGVVIKGAVLLIKAGIEVIGKIIKGIWNFLCHPIDFIMGIVKGVGNWLAGFADKEIGVWKFKFKPFGFLKGLKSEDNSDEPIKVEDGKAQEVIDELQKKLKDLLGSYANALDQIKKLNEKLKETGSMKISKMTIVNLLKSARFSAIYLRKAIMPKLKTILSRLVTIYRYLKQLFKNINKKLGFGKAVRFSKAIKDNKKKITKNIQNKAELPKKKGFLAKIKDKVNSIKDRISKTVNPVKNIKANNAGKEVNKLPAAKSTLQPGKWYQITDANREEFKKQHPEVLDHIRNAMNGSQKPKLDITPESVKTQFSSIDNINNKNKENMKNMSEDLEEMNEETESSESDDITNVDLRTFLLKMFENVDVSFAKISEKLDKPLVLPMPTPMNINNLALLGAN